MKTRKLIAFGIVSLLSLIGFSYGIDYTKGFVEYNGHDFDLNPSSNSGYFCIYIGGDFPSWDTPQGSFNYGYNCNANNGCSSWSQYTYYKFKSCVILDGYEIVNIGAGNLPSNGTVYYSFTPFPSECEVCQECPTCPVVDTGAILSGYILESSIDTPYCVENGYCPVYTGDVIDPGSGNWSALFINDIQHESAPLINLTIPEEFERDYTNDSEEFNLWVSGYNVDTAYIDGIITTQKTLPDKQDFNNTISGLLPLFIPGLVIIACLYFIFRFIKKVF